MNTVTFLDLHCVIDAALQIGGAESPKDFADARRGVSNRTDVVAAFATAACTTGSTETLIFSDYALETLRRQLVSNEDGLDELSAVRTAAVVLAMVEGTGGECFTIAELERVLPQVQNLVARHIGRAKGQVDHEDLMVLAGCLLAAEKFGTCVLVTDDTGLLNCAGDVAFQNIAILKAARYHRAAKAA